MFTGIITEIGTVQGIEHLADSARLAIRAPHTTVGAGLGESIAVAGVCLTITDLTGETFTADVMRETLRASRLGTLQAGDLVNLERAMPAGGRLDGHIVQGHVDAVARLVARTPGRAWEDLLFDVPAGVGRYVAPKGSITLDGVSLTVTTVADTEGATRFGVSLIPTTLAATTLGRLAIGDVVNVEADVVAKYIERLLAAPAAGRAGGAAAEPAVAQAGTGEDMR